MKRIWPLLIICAGCRGAAGDGYAPEESHASGHVRVFNLSNDKVGIEYKGIRMGVAKKGEATPFKPIPANGAEITLRKDRSQSTMKVNAGSGLGTTILLGASGTTKLLTDEWRYAKGVKNARVVFLDEALQPVKSGAEAKIEGPAGEMTLSASTEEAAIPPGKWHFKGVELIEPVYAYTLVFLKAQDAWQPYCLVNSQTDKARAAQQSQRAPIPPQ
ncbi:MAG: hypothetical protein ABL949_17100 [Fimbriimonadaceae bacterium]